MSKAEDALRKLNEDRKYGQKKAKKLGDTEATYTGDKYRSGDYVGEIDPKELADLDPKFVQSMYDRARATGNEVEVQKFLAMALGKKEYQGLNIALKVVRKETDNNVMTAATLISDTEKGDFEFKMDFNFGDMEDRIEFQQIVDRFYKHLVTVKKTVRGNLVKEYQKMFTYLLYNWNVLKNLSNPPKYLKDVLDCLDQMEKDKKNTWAKGLAAAYICPELTRKQQNNLISDLEAIFKEFIKPYLGR